MFDKREYMKKYNKQYNSNKTNKQIKHIYNNEYQRRMNPLYRKFYKMKERCNPQSKDMNYKLYRERGIQVLFHDKYHFAEWAISHGWQPGYDIHRINEFGHYEPDNCIFISHAEHATETNINNSKQIMRSDGIKYKSITECARENNTSIATMSRTIKSNKIFNGYYFTNIGV